MLPSQARRSRQTSVSDRRDSLPYSNMTDGMIERPTSTSASRAFANTSTGINDGRITRREANRLYRELRDVEAKERAFRSDGHIDRRENRVLTAELDRLADRVRHELRDEQRY